MFNFFKKKTSIEKFFEATNKTAFPGGTDQIQKEVVELRTLLESSLSDEKIRSVLIRGTGHLYFHLLPDDLKQSINFSTKELAETLERTCQISEKEALVFSFFIFSKEQRRRGVGQ